MPSVRQISLHLLSDGKPHSRYSIWEAVMGWKRGRILQQSIDRPLQKMEQEGILKSKVFNNVKYYKKV